MDLNIQIPDNTASIFEYLQKGLFISSNSTSEEVRDMYNEIDENYESLYQYFLQILKLLHLILVCSFHLFLRSEAYLHNLITQKYD